PTRRWKRSKLDVPVRLFSWNDSLQPIISHARGEEISLGGVGIFASVELTTEAIVEVEFIPNGGWPSRFLAQVRSRSGYRYGLEFLNHLTARLFHPCRQEEHNKCEKKLATYLCSCYCHLAAITPGTEAFASAEG
ncbi:MAG: PilZ domain-containing protein, partial [Acidobacteriota bacterium]|nr:PilZ domain-containing protein [Acidobacteriota bacterium]